MTKEELLAELKRCAELAERGDEEVAHVKADKALLAYINDPEIREAFESWSKWYA